MPRRVVGDVGEGVVAKVDAERAVQADEKVAHPLRVASRTWRVASGGWWASGLGVGIACAGATQWISVELRHTAATEL